MASSLSAAWAELPPDIMAVILHKLGTTEMLTTAQWVCRAWHTVCVNSSMWRSIDVRWPYSCRPFDLDKMCRHAVDRSQGQLIDISIQGYVSDELLLYISQKCSQLRRLSLKDCYYHDMSYGVFRAVKRLHLLEELHLHRSCFKSKAIEAIGRSCPLLKSFTCCFYTRKSVVQTPDDTEVRAIAENMPKLRHLKLNGDAVTDKGLRCILDGCPHLESLDLTQCSRIKFDLEIDRLCRERIRDLKRPLRYQS